MTDGPESFHALVVAVAGDTVIFDQFLVKGDILLFLFNGQTFGGFFANLFYFVTGDALRGWAADKRCVAGKTICSKLGMGINGLSWADHQLWREYRQQNQGGQINSNNKDDGLIFHFHSQNRKILRI